MFKLKNAVLRSRDEEVDAS